MWGCRRIILKAKTHHKVLKVFFFYLYSFHCSLSHVKAPVISVCVEISSVFQKLYKLKMSEESVIQTPRALVFYFLFPTKITISSLYPKKTSCHTRQKRRPRNKILTLNLMRKYLQTSQIMCPCSKVIFINTKSWNKNTKKWALRSIPEY